MWSNQEDLREKLTIEGGGVGSTEDSSGSQLGAIIRRRDCHAY